VRILTESDITDAMPVKYASRQGYEQLLKGGYEIYEFQPTMMHVKAMVIDDLWSVFGSANFDNRSFELNDELTIAVSDPQLAGTLTRDFDADLKRSKRLDVETWAQRPMIDKSREFFWSFFSEIF
jgi:cardiolipin synthase A/B